MAPKSPDVLNFAKGRVTLYGKIVALSSYGLLKTSEGLICNLGGVNATCLLFKTDICPILGVLKLIGVNARASPLNLVSISVLTFNFTEAKWKWVKFPAAGRGI
ncbi:hypothetical protein Pogu_2050 [Pyrobaculum oguniense TE7]|uniref:Uncharacterized protein n=1 Tax=Pyrobaculum oguniense (strain DSM 13380 / JCM 10595 / TE7) TaxID=698757 RepID=H6QB80_PYROT|nr:hypothetical protein Pogu_2050 [Pyrobaculum oguniense TE7]